MACLHVLTCVMSLCARYQHIQLILRWLCDLLCSLQGKVGKLPHMS